MNRLLHVVAFGLLTAACAAQTSVSDSADSSADAAGPQGASQGSPDASRDANIDVDASVSCGQTTCSGDGWCVHISACAGRPDAGGVEGGAEAGSTCRDPEPSCQPATADCSPSTPNACRNCSCGVWKITADRQIWCSGC